MTGDDYGRAIYLVLLLLVVAGYFIVDNRAHLGRVAQQAMIWGLIFVGFIAVFGLWSDIRSDLSPRQSVSDAGAIELPRAPDGHFYLTAQINGADITFVVDTGATDIVLSQDDARAVGIDPDALDYLGSASTANGVVRTARVTLDDFRLEGMADTRLRAVVNQGDLDGSLLGMAYLDRFSRIEIAGDRMILTR